MEAMRPVWAEINLDNLEHNIREIKKISRNSEIIAVIKADAYGHSAIDVANFLNKEGIDRLAVAVITEAIELRQGGINSRILAMGYVPIEYSDEIIDKNIEVTVYNMEHAIELSNAAKKRNKTIKIHIKVDTGMGRLGFLVNESSIDEIYEISKLENLELEGIFSHFSSADEVDKTYTKNQNKLFKEVVETLKDRGVNFNTVHIANSAGFMEFSDREDEIDTFFDAVRIGILLYGYYPSCNVKKERLELRPVLSLKARITHIKEVEVGTAISYGRTYVTDSKRKIATIPIGYADGYLRGISNVGYVIVNGEFAKVIGNICMDQCMIDITDIKDVKNNDEVILIGSNGDKNVDAEVVASWLNTISYEIINLISKRVPRVFIKNGVKVKTRNYV